MGVLFKLLKELNSAENDKFISLAVVLGLIAGFLPFFNIFTLLILFFAFIIRIPFGLFLASWSVFSIVGYFLDPLLAKTGYVVLTSSILNPIFEALYNTPLMRWSGYNNTVVMGGLIWGVILGAILYFALNKSIKVYRDRFFSFCEKHKFLRWIVPNKNKKSKLFRLSGIIAFGVIFGSIALVITLFLDPVIKFALEFGLSKALHKNVTIQTLNISFTKAEIDMKNIYVGDIKTDEVLVKLSWKYLVWKKFDIQKLIISNIHTNKSIQVLIANAKVQKHKEAQAKKIVKKVSLALPKPKDLLANYKLESLEKIKKLKTDYQAFLKESKNIKDTLKDEKAKINKIKSDINNLQNSTKSIKSLNDINTILSQVEIIKKEINSLKSDLGKKKNRLLALKKQILNDIKEVKTASKNDYRNIAKKYDMLNKGEYVKFAESFLKPQIDTYVNTALKYYNIIKPYIHSKKEENKYNRAKGMYIKYKDKILYPDFVLQFAKISGKTTDANLKGVLKNISSNQTLLNRYGVINLTSTSKYYKYAYLNAKYLHKIDFQLTGNDIKIHKFNIKNIDVINSNVDLKSIGEINGDNLNVKTDIKIKPKKIAYEGNKYIKGALNSIKMLNLDILISGDIKNYVIKINSNLDNIMSTYLRSELNKQINKQKAKLNKLINEKISNELKNVGIKSSDFNIINDITNTQKSTDSLNDLLKKYTKKELSKKLLNKGLGNFIKF